LQSGAGGVGVGLPPLPPLAHITESAALSADVLPSAEAGLAETLTASRSLVRSCARVLAAVLLRPVTQQGRKLLSCRKTLTLTENDSACSRRAEKCDKVRIGCRVPAGGPREENSLGVGCYIFRLWPVLAY